MSDPRILTLDIETAPATVYTYSLFQKVIGIGNVIEGPRILCLAAKWHGSRDVFFLSEWSQGREGMLKAIHQLMDEADYIVSWNGQRFDVPWLNGEFLKVGLEPPSPHRDIDLMLTAKKRFRFLSNKLDWYARELGIGQKVNHQGIGLWRSIMEDADDVEDARKIMRRYNVQDVRLTEQIFDRMRPWIQGINMALFQGGTRCRNCGSVHLIKKGFAITTQGKYQRLKCTSCGAWTREKKAIYTSNTGA